MSPRSSIGYRSMKRGIRSSARSNFWHSSSTWTASWLLCKTHTRPTRAFWWYTISRENRKTTGWTSSHWAIKMRSCPFTFSRYAWWRRPTFLKIRSWKACVKWRIFLLSFRSQNSYKITNTERITLLHSWRWLIIWEWRIGKRQIQRVSRLLIISMSKVWLRFGTRDPLMIGMISGIFSTLRL